MTGEPHRERLDREDLIALREQHGYEPVGLRVSPLAFARRRWRGLAFFAAVALGAFLWKGLGLLVGAVVLAQLAWLGAVWGSAKHAYRHGALCAGVVLSRSPGRIAAFFDLGVGTGRALPIIRVADADLHADVPLGLWPGDRVVVVGAPQSSSGEPPYGDLRTTVAGALAISEDSDLWLTSRIAQESWDALREGLEMLPPELSVGLYALTGDWDPGQHGDLLRKGPA